MTVSSSSDDQITLWRTWALTVTHKACEYTEQKFNAEKTGGDPVIPSPKLDTELVMAFQTQANIARYGKLVSLKDTRHNEEREEKLLQRCPPGHEDTMLIDKPATIIDIYGAIIAWYLPDALTNATQVCKLYYDLMDIEYQMVPTEGNLGGLQFACSKPQKSVKVDSNWQTNQEWFKQSPENVGITPGCINLSPA
ncbi:hypothetical protein BD769DRAFT_1389232 [Suillus cothurnatus]|nr:hypothetical protein BD769DRAFT_1389232 [Suillus cothurnatus]